MKHQKRPQKKKHNTKYRKKRREDSYYQDGKPKQKYKRVAKIQIIQIEQE